MVTLSVVIPTHNRVHSLQRVLAGLAAQTLSATAFEVVVVADGATDNTLDTLAAAQTKFQLVALQQAQQGPGSARNLGVARAAGDLIVFLDDDVVPAPQLLSEHLNQHAAHSPGAVVIGPMVAPSDHAVPPWVHWSQDRLAEQYRAMATGAWAPTARQFYTGNTSLMRQALLDSGGFNPAFSRAEDVELAYRLAARGLHFVFSPLAIGYHYEHRTFATWLSIPYDYGRFDVKMTYESDQAWLLPTILAEFRGRPRFVQWITRACLDRPLRRQWATITFRHLAALGNWRPTSLMGRAACSSLFNLYHYQGIADALGGRARFFDLSAAAASANSEPSRPRRSGSSGGAPTRHV